MLLSYRLRLLGSPAILSSEEDDLGLPLGKPMAALCFVALESTRVTRDDLGNVLWPDVPRERARGSVRQALWLIRKVLGAEVIEERNGRLRLASGVRTDLDGLGETLAAGRLVDAWSAWRGGPLAGFSIPDAPRWNAWAERVRGDWRRRLGEALEVRAAAEDGEARITWLRRALEVRPERESVHAALVETFIHQHRLDEAEAALYDARSVVDDPTPGLLDDLADRLRALRRRAFQGTDDTLRLEFVGRATEFSALTALWRSVRSGRPRVAAILGPAGIGKTRLAEQFLELVELEDARVVAAKGMDTEAIIDLGTVALLVKQLLHLPGAAGISSGSAHTLRSLVPSEDRNGDPPAPVPGKAELGDALSDLVVAVAQESPLILHVEDVHWIDRCSLALLLRLVRSLGRVPVLLLMTCRTEERDVSALRALRRLEGEGGVGLLSLRPLARAEVAEMLGLMFTFGNATEADECADRLHRVSGGNPLFLLELLRHLGSRGLIDEEEGDGDWPVRRLHVPDTLTLPRTVEETLGRRIAGLSPDARTVAAVLARSKTALESTELARRAGLGDSRFALALGETLQCAVVRWTRSDLLEIAHDSLREGLRRNRPRRGRLRSRLFRWAWLPGAAAVFVLLFATLREPGAAASDAPFGGGVLFVSTGDRFVGFHLRSGKDGRPHLDAADTIRLPKGLKRSGAPARSRTGRWIVPAVGVEGPDKAPDAWVVETGRPKRVWATPGDDAVTDVGPGNGQYLVGTEDEESPEYRRNLVRIAADSGALTFLASGTAGGQWARDGSVIAADLTAAPWDSVAIIRPDGTRLHTVASPDPHLQVTSWCDARRAVLGLSLPDGELARAWMWHPGDGPPQPLDLRYPAAGWLQCSPDGSVVAYQGWVDGRTVLVIQEIDGSRAWTFPEIDVAGLSVDWVLDEPPEAPRSVTLAPDSVALVRGERRHLSAVVEGAPGFPANRGSWTSSDPLTVFVSERGELVGNGPGVAVVRYVVDGWLSDSVRVRVEQNGHGATEIRFSDPLAELDPERWRVEGFPPPESVVDDQGQPVLEMDGDGRFDDGIISEESFDLSDGATVEVDFRLRLTRRDRQSIELDLYRGEPLPEGSLPSRSWRVDERIGVLWPGFQLADFDEGLAQFFAAGPPMGAVSVAGALRASEWNRLSIQLQADGRASLYLNGQHIATAATRVDLTGKRWHIALMGRGVDTHLLVRNVVLWGAPMYGVESADR